MLVQITLDGAQADGGVWNNGCRPWRWMPLEALRDATFSHKSDVFGFGVLVWEMCTLGKPPWGAFGLQDVVQGLRDGDRLQRPSDCPDQLYDLCKALRLRSPAFRPSFSVHAVL